LRITGVGDCGVDRYLNQGVDRPGGITLNFAVNARRLFPATDTVGVVTALGTDPEADLVRRAVASFGLLACLIERPGPTSLQYIDQHPSGEKIFVRYEAGVLADYRVGERERALIAESDVLMAAAYSQVEGFFSSVMNAPSPGLRAVDFGDLANWSDGPGFVEECVGRLHLGFFGLGTDDGARIDRLERIARDHRRVFVVTLGADGSVALGETRRLACPAVAVAQVVDTTGAGDTFAAGFLSEYCRTRDVAASLECGSRHAAESIQGIGAFPWPVPPQ
jgi:fructoselysine 6-kinase